MSKLEIQIQDDVRLVLGADRSSVWWRNNVGTAKTERGTTITFGLSPGSADLIGCFRGRFVAVELKTEVGRQSKNQKLWQGQVEDRGGGIYAIVRSEDDARALLVELHRRFPATEPA
jgi:hypothetical protein